MLGGLTGQSAPEAGASACLNVATQDLTEKRKDFPGPENVLAEINQRKTSYEQVTCPRKLKPQQRMAW